jgi:hypothetical protein
MPLTISLRPNPNPTGGKKSLNAFPYSSLPEWHSIRDNVTISYSTIQGPVLFNFVNLTAVTNWHASNASAIYTTFIPSTYFYAFDGVFPNQSTSIADGGNGFDMFDVGNYIGISTNRGLSNVYFFSNILYGTISTLSNQNFGYTTTSRNIWPQVSLSFIKEGTILWRAGGNVGSDNRGVMSNISSTYTTNRGLTGRFWANQGFAQANDPSICYTWFTIESTSWNTLISSVTNGLSVGAVPPDDMNQFMRVTGCNFIFGMFLLSARRPPLATGGVGFFLSTVFIQSFLSNYVENANILVS